MTQPDPAQIMIRVGKRLGVILVTDMILTTLPQDAKAIVYHHLVVSFVRYTPCSQRRRQQGPGGPGPGIGWPPAG